MIKICKNHQEYQTPLIGTMAWNGAEYWCPYCGYHEGFLRPIKVERTEELQKRHDLYLRESGEYLNAVGILSCCETIWKGKQINPKDLPKKEKQRLAQLRTTWKLNTKIEELI